MTVEQEYEDLLTCSSDTSSETAKLRIVAGIHYHSSGNFVCKNFSNIHLVNFKSFCTVTATFNSLVNFKSFCTLNSRELFVLVLPQSFFHSQMILTWLWQALQHPLLLTTVWISTLRTPMCR